MDTLNIFVSGTIDDQRAERNTVGAAIESLRLDATRAETQYSSERSSRDECLRMVRDCNVYLGVFTQMRYGWTIPADRISVTEMEFDEAQRLKKPTLIFVQKLPKDWTPKDDKEKEQREKQKTFLNRVLDFDGGKFRAAEFETLAQLENQVAGSLMQMLVERFKMTVSRPPFLAPRNLDVFVGRAAQIETLTRSLARGETALVHGFYGVGGLGKTALALHIAYALRGQFDGGVLWADLPTVRPDQTLADWAREYGQDISRIEETDARADALRTILRGRRVLAFLDGAVDESDDEKIAPLLRALADCAVIVTSRVTQLNSLANASRVNLDKMSENEAVELFERIVGAGSPDPLPRDKIIAIARVVDFLPLALDLAAAQWREHSSWAADDVLAILRDERARLDTLNWGDGKTRGIRASIESSYKRLTGDEQTFFAALGAFAGDDFDVRAAEFVSASEDARGHEKLERFLRLSLVQEGRRALRYRLHPLLRDYARERTTDKNGLNGRMARYYCALAGGYGPKLQSDIETALPILDAEISNIYAGQDWALTQDDQVGWELCRDYMYGAMTYYFNLRAMWNDWIEWGEAGIEACQKLGDEHGEGVIAGNLGLVYADKGEWDKAIEFYQNALGTMEKVGDIHGMAQTWGNLGAVYKNQGKIDDAIAFYKKSLEITERLGDIVTSANQYWNMGNIFEEQNEFPKALEWKEKAMNVWTQVGSPYAAEYRDQLEELRKRSSTQ